MSENYDFLENELSRRGTTNFGRLYLDFRHRHSMRAQQQHMASMNDVLIPQEMKPTMPP